MEQFSFENLVGNAYTLNLLERSLTNGTFKPFTIFSGTMGTGKSTSAKIASMYLTCEDLKDGKPCMNCPTCRANLKAFGSTGESSRVKVINAGRLFRQDDVGKVIKDVFSFEHGTASHVYIFEEVHALKGVQGAQVALLEELDRIPDNTYVIMCTTKSYDLIPELRSRAVEFSFARLNRSESALLLNMHTADKYGQALPSEVSAMIVAEAKGIPRDCLKLADFVVENNVSYEEMKEYLREVTDSTLISLFQSMSQKDAGTYLTQASELLEKRNPQDVLHSMQGFLVKCLFLIEGGIKDGFTSIEAEDVKQLFDLKTLGQITQAVEGLKGCTSADGFMLGLFKIRLIVQKRTLLDVCAEKKSIGANERIHAAALAEEVNVSESGQRAKGFKKISPSFLNGFGD